MIAATLDIGWEAMIVLVTSVFVLGFLLVIFLVRNPTAKRLRVGMFLERERPDEVEHYDEDDAPTKEWPQVKP